ncbi:ferric reductase-like transmembrane domain-containing protein [Tropicimonas sp. TH_r6]|uniref:ferric reductase-like transmembrane domain-containing protein n=1 Tax=Tropicimonas sp. TH_r6 TaxID=3082085 RepID=UPI002953C5E3|nr:ferric reductase-like transmembrane domain-containing protein [Tropicimonas sp. TH_r6]MDV7143472.1 ferric reductase-like transmembrane domain-containing protein [Tropicimonas sp. TH_r6]
MRRTRPILVWGAMAAALVVPVALAASSPLLAWRDPVYIAAGFAGIAAMALLLVQPLLAGGVLPGLPLARARRIHRWTGIALVAVILFHVAALWITSPPDVIDALLFRSPTPFSAWGVIAMWAGLGAATLAAFRRKLGVPWRIWRGGHLGLAAVTIAGSVVHAMLIEGTMELLSKALLCGLVLVVSARTLADLVGSELRRHRRKRS